MRKPPFKRHEPPRRSGAPDELKVSGQRAVAALFAYNRTAIRRLFFDREMAAVARPMCDWLARQRRSYRLVPDDELQRIAGTLHHGGIVAAIAPPKLRPPPPRDIAAWSEARAPLVILDGVSNPHNFGAILRTAAFLGIAKIVLSERPEQAMPSEAAYRVAEGGLESVELFRPAALAAFCRGLTAQFRLIGTGPRGVPLSRLKPDPRPPALVLGNEETGLSPAVAQACDALVAIPGTGRIESLNVSVAAGVLMYELFVRPRDGQRS
jgi:TrmH RNA methyltransferase